MSHSNATLTNQASRWANECASRLRLLQINCADTPAAQRREFLREALGDALKGIPAAEREVCLSALAGQFPAWSVPAPAAESASAPLEVKRTSQQVLEELVAMASEVPADTKAAFSKRLQDAGFLPRSPSFQGEAIKDLQTAYGLACPPTMDRVAELLAMLADTLEKLDQVACKTLENLPSRSDFRNVSSEDFHEALRSFLAADAGTGAELLEAPLRKVLERHRRAMTALIASPAGMRGVPSAGKEFARWFQDLFSPSNIRDIVEAEKSSMFGLGGGVEERCWKKYAQRYREEFSTQEHVEKKVKDAVANSAERIFQLKA